METSSFDFSLVDLGCLLLGGQNGFSLLAFGGHSHFLEEGLGLADLLQLILDRHPLLREPSSQISRRLEGAHEVLGLRDLPLCVVLVSRIHLNFKFVTY